MGHIALYREWRPKTFDEIVEQNHTVAALRQAVLTGNIAHAYLFSGTRGTGKTTMAQVFSRAINCLSPDNGNPCNHCAVCTGIQNGTVLDVIEMDAASNNSVDTIRRLCDEIVFTPSVAKYKVYIIDEVHMLSTGAFNALLKTLEEPPAHAVFILATTEQYRIPATILSRCQRYEFRRIPVASIAGRLREIADSDGVAIQEDALKAIAQIADGALRDAISLLDQAKGSFQGTITKEDILSLVGIVNDDFLNQMALAVIRKNPDQAMHLIEEFILDGRDVIRFTTDLAAYFRNVMICKVTRKPEELVYSPSKTIEGMMAIASVLPLDSILFLIRQLSALLSDLRWSQNTRITFEISLIRMMDSPELILPDGDIPIPAAAKEVPVRKLAAQAAQAAPGVPKVPEVPEVPVFPESEVLPAPVENPAIPVPAAPFADTATDAALQEQEKDLQIVKTEESEDAVDLAGKIAESAIPEDLPPDIDTKALWSCILDNIISAGQMTVYLFLLPAKPLFKKDELKILFEDKDHLNYIELAKKQNYPIISQAVFQATGLLYTISLGLASEESKKAAEIPVRGESGPPADTDGANDSPAPEQSEQDPFGALKNSAKELGISFYMEE